MRNIIQQQDDLKNLSQQQLVTAMQSGAYPQFLVLSELNRRKRMANDQARREAVDDTNTVAQEVVNATGVPQGGIAQLASAMNAKTDNTQNTGIQKMAEGGVVKAQPGGLISNIMSLMSPPSYDVAGLSKPRVAQEPEMTGLEAIETIPPDAARALEISKKLKVGRGVKKALKELKMTGLEAANLILGAGAYITLDTAYKSLNLLSTVFPQEEAKVILDLAQTLEDGQEDILFKKHGNWLQRNLPRLNPNFAYTFDDREKAAEQLSIEELEAIRKSSEAAIAKSDTYDEFGDRPASFASLFAEGTPSLPITGKYKLPRTFAGTNVGPFGEGPAKFTMGDRSISQGDVFPSGPLAVAPKPESAVRPDVAEEISRLGRPIQTSISQQPPSTSSIIKSPLADDPFRLEGAAKKEQLRNFIATEDPKFYGPAAKEMGQRAREFYNTDTFTPPSEIYGSTDVYGPELGALFAQTLKNQQAGIPGGNTPEATMAMNLENAARLREENLANPQLPLSLFERAKMYLEGLGRDIRGMTQEDVIEFAKSLGAKGLDLVDDVAQAGSDFLTTRANNKASAAFDSDTLGVGSEPPNFKEIDRATAKQLAEEQDATDTASQTQIDKLMELLNKQQSAIDKQSGASSAALSEYLSGLEKDREFDKAMALANAGAALMMPSATIGEGVGKMIKAGTKTLQKGKDSYNKNKLQVLALQGRIDAAKAAAANRAAISGATVSSRILLKRREELAEQLERIAPMGTNPEGPLADRAAALREAIKQTDDQLNALITTASIGSIPTGSDIFANYDLT